MKQSTLYLLLVIPGIAAPWLFLLGFFRGGGPSIPLFFASIFVNSVSSAVAADLIVSCLVFFAFVWAEGRRLGLDRLWVYILASLCLGLSVGLPLFLSTRARAIESDEAEDLMAQAYDRGGVRQ